MVQIQRVDLTRVREQVCKLLLGGEVMQNWEQKGWENIFFFQAEVGIRDPLWSRELGDVYKRQEPI